MDATSSVTTSPPVITCPNDISKLSVRDINSLLKEHGLNLKGKKSFKVQRLCELFNFTTEVGSFQSALTAVRNTSTGWTKDIRKAPQIELQQISKYLLCAHDTTTHISCEDLELFTPQNLRRYKTLRSYELYSSGHIHSMCFLEMVDSSSCAIRGKCNPSWDTSGKTYDCVVLFDKEVGDPVGSSCTCTAGQGEACTHAAALLFAMEDFTSLGLHELPDDPASTELLCKWSAPKDSKVESVPVKDLTFKKRTPLVTEKPSKRKNFDGFIPVAPAKRAVNLESYQRLIHKLNMVQPDVPFLTIADPLKWGAAEIVEEPPTYHSLPDVISEDCVALVPAAEEDVETSDPRPDCIQQVAKRFVTSGNNISPSLVEDFISTLTITNEEQAQIEQLTMGQNNTPNWQEYRSGMITASAIHKVHTRMRTLSAKPECEPTKLLLQFTGKTKFQGNSATRYGHANEPVAARRYDLEMASEHRDFQLSMCGLTVLKEHSFIGASLDRTATCKCHGMRVVEIKCPASLSGKPSGSFDSLKYLTSSDEKLTLNSSHIYYSQVQCQMAVSKIPAADFVIWSPQDMIVIPVSFDVEHWNRLLSSATSFFRQYLGPALLGSGATSNPQASTSGTSAHHDGKQRAKFVDEHICAEQKCRQIIKDQENISDDDENSVQCGCSCKCGKWFHIKCTNLKELTVEEIEAVDWSCPKCINYCDFSAMQNEF